MAIHYPAIIAGLLALVAALATYVGVIQKERELEMARPLLSVRCRPGAHGVEECVVCNVGGGPALAVRIGIGDLEVRRDVLAGGEEIALPVRVEAPFTVEIRYRGVSRPAREAVRRFGPGPDGAVYSGGHDQPCGIVNRHRMEM